MSVRTLWVLMAVLSTISTYAQQTYVIHTYGDPDIVRVAQDELNRGGGGTAVMYQDKLIIQAHPDDYARVSKLVQQIDSAPAPLTISVAVSHHIHEHQHGGQINVGISQKVWVNGRYQNDTRTTSTVSTYTARTLSGAQVGIGSSTLIGLSTWQAHQTGARFWVNFGTSWVSLSDGFYATPKLMPNGQILLNISQHNHHQHQQYALNTAITLPKGQWVKIGEMAKNSQNTQAGFGFGGGYAHERLPIWVRVD